MLNAGLPAAEAGFPGTVSYDHQHIHIAWLFCSRGAGKMRKYLNSDMLGRNNRIQAVNKVNNIIDTAF